MESLRLRCQAFHLHIVCLDAFTETFLTAQQYPEVTCVPLGEVERWATELLDCKHRRTPSEYCYTLSPFVPLYVLRQNPEFDFVCSLDADLYFYQDPTQLFADFDRYSILITTHNFDQNRLEERLKTGVYNVCFQAFRNDATGLACLEKWRRQCTEWCLAHYDSANDRFADQKYLESWPDDFAGQVKVLNGPSTNLAIWNVNQYRLKCEHNELKADGISVVFYHFHGIRLLSESWVGNTFHWYDTRPQKVLLRNVYAPYLTRIFDWEKKLAQAGKPVPYEQRILNALTRAIKAGAVFYRYRKHRLMHLNFHWIYQLHSSIKQTRWPARSIFRLLPTTEAT